MPVYIFCSLRWLSVALPLVYVSCMFLKHLLFTTASKAAGLYLKQAFVIISMWLVYAVYVSSTRQTLVFQHYAVNTNSTVRCPFQIKSPLMFLCIQQSRQCLATTHSCTCFPDCIICNYLYIGLFTCKISIHCSPIIMCVALKVSVVRFVLFDLKKKWMSDIFPHFLLSIQSLKHPNKRKDYTTVEKEL